ncbi:MAG TPA: phosphatidate cytidylyltransferase [Chitinophagaceae bacterium]
MFKTKLPLLLIFFAIFFSSCQAIGDIFSAGVWVGIVIVIVIIIILFAVFRKKS